MKSTGICVRGRKSAAFMHDVTSQSRSLPGIQPTFTTTFCMLKHGCSLSSVEITWTLRSKYNMMPTNSVCVSSRKLVNIVVTCSNMNDIKKCTTLNEIYLLTPLTFVLGLLRFILLHHTIFRYGIVERCMNTIHFL